MEMLPEYSISHLSKRTHSGVSSVLYDMSTFVMNKIGNQLEGMDKSS